MNYLKIISKPFVFLFLFIIISFFILTLLNYFNILGYKLTIYLKLILSIIAFSISGFKIGKNSIKKGWLQGIKFSSLVLFIMFIISLFTKEFETKTFIFYSILLLSTIIGSMFGITKKKETN